MSKNKYSKPFDKANMRIGKLFGENYSLYRADYSETDNTPALIKAKVKVRVDPTGAKRFPEPNFTAVEVYSVFGPRNLLQEGDILLQGTVADPNIYKAASTLMHWGEEKEMVSLRTSRRCNIAISQDDETGVYEYLFTNVFYDLIGIGYTQGNVVTLMDKSGVPIRTERVALFTRPALVSASYSGLTLLETDNEGVETGHKWTINQVDWSGPLTVLTISRAR